MNFVLIVVLVGAVVGAVALFIRSKNAEVAGGGALSSDSPNATGTPSGPPVHWLVGEQGEVKGKTFLIGSRSVTLGRATTNFVQLNTGDASRVHCQIRPTSKGLLLTDLKSANGTFVNGTRVREQVLREGDAIRVGDAVLVYREHVDAAVDHGLGRKEVGAVQSAETRLEASGQGWGPMITDALKANGGDLNTTARQLGLTVDALQGLMAKHGVGQ